VPLSTTTLPAAVPLPIPIVILANDKEGGDIAVAGAKMALAVINNNSNNNNNNNNNNNLTQPTDDDMSMLSGDCNSIQHGKELVFLHSMDSETFSVHDFTETYLQAETRNGGVKPILHAFLDRPSLALSTLLVWDSISFLGLTPIVAEPSTASAERVGRFLQQILACNKNSYKSCCISWEWPAHLSVLRANALPKSSAHDDTFLILPIKTIPELVLVEYVYDTTRLGGSDPLLCPANEFSYPFPLESGASTKVPVELSKYATAAAYTVLRGNGVSKTVSACIACSVGLCLTSGYNNDSHGRLFARDIARTISLTTQCRRAMIKGPVVRKRYIEYGYT
jgi:hypothetical protein